jgi:hypothetical protein
VRIPIVLSIFRKDVVDAMRDSRILVSLLTPLLLAVVYNSIFPEERLFEAKVAYVGPETSALVRTLQERAGQTVDLSSSARAPKPRRAPSSRTRTWTSHS